MAKAPPMSKRSPDFAACGLSAACLAHCLLLPVAASLAPILGTVAEAEWVHWVFVTLSAPLAIIAFWRPTASWTLRFLAVLGIVLLLAGACEFPSHHWEAADTVVGALFLATAHALNAFGMLQRAPATPMAHHVVLDRVRKT